MKALGLRDLIMDQSHHVMNMIRGTRERVKTGAGEGAYDENDSDAKDTPVRIKLVGNDAKGELGSSMVAVEYSVAYEPGGEVGKQLWIIV